MNNIIINILHKIATKLNTDKKPCSAITQNNADLGKQKPERYSGRFPESIANDRKVTDRERNHISVCVGMDSKRVPRAPLPIRVFGSHHPLSSSFVPSFSLPYTCCALAHGVWCIVCSVLVIGLLSSCIGSKSTVEERFSDSICNDYKAEGTGTHVSGTYTNYKDSVFSWSHMAIESLIKGHESIIFSEVEDLSTDSAGVQYNRRQRTIEVSRDIDSRTASTAIDSTHLIGSGLTTNRDSLEILASTSNHSTSSHEAEKHKKVEVESKSLVESIVPKDIFFAALVIVLLLWLIVRRDSGNPFGDL